MRVSTANMAQLAQELLSCRYLTKSYTLFLKEEWIKFQLESLAQEVGYKIETPKEFVDVCHESDEEMRANMC
jgi:hypothetical protein